MQLTSEPVIFIKMLHSLGIQAGSVQYGVEGALMGKQRGWNSPVEMVSNLARVWGGGQFRQSSWRRRWLS